MRKILFALLLLPSLSWAQTATRQIDYFLKFTNETQALAALTAFNGLTAWPLDYAFPDLKFWRNSLDNGDGSHNYLTGYYVMISLPRVNPTLRDHPAVQIVIDREATRARLPGAVIRSTVTNVILQDLRFSPVPAGSDYPFGNMQ